MKLNSFFKPTKAKIIIFVLLMTISILYAGWLLFPVACLQGCVVSEEGEQKLDCPSCPLSDYNSLLPFSLLLIIPNYFIACFLVYFGRKVKFSVKKVSLN